MPSEIGHLKPDNETHKSCKDAQRCAKMQKLARCLHEGLIWPNLARNCVLLIVFWLAHGIARIKVGSVLFVLFLLGSKSDQKSELPKVRVRGGDAVMSGKFLWSLRSINVLSILICFWRMCFTQKSRPVACFLNMEIWIAATGGVTVAAALCLASRGIL